MAVGNPNYDAMLSSTFQNYRPQFADNLSKSFWLMYWLTTKDRKRHEDGGESIVVPLMYGKNTTVKSYDGYEVLDTTPQEGLTSAKFPWKQVAGSISISRKEERQNSGESRIINLLQSKVRQAEISMRDTLNGMFFGDGTGNNSKDIYGLQLLVEEGTAWGTVGGIDASDALNTWWRNQWTGALTGWGTGFAPVTAMRTGYNKASRGNEHPDMGVTDRASFELYENCLVPLERFENKEVADAGFSNLRFKGVTLGYDEQCTAAYMWFLNSNYIEFVVDSQTDLVTTDFVRPENQDAKVAQILIMGNLVISNRARHWLGTAIAA